MRPKKRSGYGKRFEMHLDERAISDLQSIIDYYNSKQQGLGEKFFRQIKHCLKLLEGNPYFRIRYDAVRCLPVRKFPYMIHLLLKAERWLFMPCYLLMLTLKKTRFNKTMTRSPKLACVSQRVPTGLAPKGAG